eukprot:CAMPEP_0206600258 /NCGR_PEP_ID=MMETSP0325_2-20121206/45685_1 /ASSEMBLY_ACC=CAM_ASM_000347 /TAXON_ID=2866 /ORGANISM="Crypthecodinium cohnii, Strain Seligo" /LENGTH=508 /DNA_ID=CAMNT_0054111521 /DNA_START=29 /DNA_END=1556 /DNA_ORIENTATION=+
MAAAALAKSLPMRGFKGGFFAAPKVPAPSLCSRYLAAAKHSPLARAAATVASGTQSTPAATPAPAFLEVTSTTAPGLARMAQKALVEGSLGEAQWQAFAARASQLAPEMSVPEAAKLAAAFSTARFGDFELFSRLSARTLERLRAIEATEEGTLGGEGRSEFQAVDRSFDSELMEALVPVIAERANDFRPRDLTQIADAYARMPVADADFFAFLADVLAPYVYDLSAPELARLCRAFANAAVYSEDLFDALCSEAKQRARTFGALDALTFIDALSRVQVSLPEDMLREDSEVIRELAHRVAVGLGTLSPSELIRAFKALVQLDYYDRRLVHGKLCPALANRLAQLQGPSAFAELIDLLNCLSLLPAQSQRSAELTSTTLAAIRSKGYPLTGRPEPKALALLVQSLVQLGQDDEELYELVGSAITQGSASTPSQQTARQTTAQPHSLLSLVSDEELEELHQALALATSPSAKARLSVARQAITTELKRRKALDAATTHGGIDAETDPEL